MNSHYSSHPSNYPLPIKVKFSNIKAYLDIPYPFRVLLTSYLTLFCSWMTCSFSSLIELWQHNLDFWIWKIVISLLGIVWGNSLTLNNSEEVDNWWATAFNAYVEKIKDLRMIDVFHWNWCQIIFYFVLRKDRSYNQATINNKSYRNDGSKKFLPANVKKPSESIKLYGYYILTSERNPL